MSGELGTARSMVMFILSYTIRLAIVLPDLPGCNILLAQCLFKNHQLCKDLLSSPILSQFVQFSCLFLCCEYSIVRSISTVDDFLRKKRSLRGIDRRACGTEMVFDLFDDKVVRSDGLFRAVPMPRSPGERFVNFGSILVS